MTQYSVTLITKENETEISKKNYNVPQSTVHALIVLGVLTIVYDVTSSSGDLLDRAPHDRGCVF